MPDDIEITHSLLDSWQSQILSVTHDVNTLELTRSLVSERCPDIPDHILDILYPDISKDNTRNPDTSSDTSQDFPTHIPSSEPLTRE